MTAAVSLSLLSPLSLFRKCFLFCFFPSQQRRNKDIKLLERETALLNRMTC